MNKLSKFGFKKALALALSAGIVLSATAALLNVENYTASAETVSASQLDYSEVLEPQVLDVPATVSSTSSLDGYFNGGDGTAENPYKISNADQFMHIADCSSTMTSQDLHFVLTTNINLNGKFSGSTTVQYICSYFNGSLDGKGWTITAPAGYQVWLATHTIDEASFENIIIQQNTGSFGLLVYAGYYVSQTGNNYGVSFTDIDVIGSSTTIEYDYNDSAFLCIGIGEISFTRCINEANLNMKSYAGIFIGGYTNNAKVSFVDCENWGVITGQYVGFFTGNSPSENSAINLDDENFSNFVSPHTHVYVSGCVNYVTMTGTVTCSPFATNVSSTATQNEEANAAVRESGAFYEEVALVSGNNILSNGVSASVSNKVVTFSSSNGTIDEEKVNSYSLRVSISIGMLKSDGTSAGSGYIWIDTAFGNTITDVNSLYYTQIIGSDKYEDETSIAYDDISGQEKYEAYFGIAYKTVETTTGYIIVVNSADALAKISVAMPNTVSVSINNTPTYRLNAYDSSSTVIGSAICEF